MSNSGLLRTARAATAVAFALAVAVSAHVERRVHAQSPSPADSVCNIQTTERIVAVGDIHGAFDNFVAILRAAQVIDNRSRWNGRRTVLVQTGDILDRGPDSRKAIDLLRRLERDAERAGGRVVSLLGNHEFMRLVSDWRYVSPGEIDAFKTGDSAQYRDQVFAALSQQAEQRAKTEGREFDAAAYREQFMKEVPLGMIELRQAFGPQGEYAKWVRERPAVAKINGVLFLHGGISPEIAPLGCEGINAAVSKELAALPPPEQAASLMAASEMGPLWYRGLALQKEEEVRARAPDDARADEGEGDRDRPLDGASRANRVASGRESDPDRYRDGEWRVLSRGRELGARMERHYGDGNLPRSPGAVGRARTSIRCARGVPLAS